MPEGGEERDGVNTVGDARKRQGRIGTTLRLTVRMRVTVMLLVCAVYFTDAELRLCLSITHVAAANLRPSPYYL